jgi:hypothetical protein
VTGGIIDILYVIWEYGSRQEKSSKNRRSRKAMFENRMLETRDMSRDGK